MWVGVSQLTIYTIESHIQYTYKLLIWQCVVSLALWCGLTHAEEVLFHMGGGLKFGRTYQQGTGTCTHEEGACTQWRRCINMWEGESCTQGRGTYSQGRSACPQGTGTYTHEGWGCIHREQGACTQWRRGINLWEGGLYTGKGDLSMYMWEGWICTQGRGKRGLYIMGWCFHQKTCQN